MECTDLTAAFLLWMLLPSQVSLTCGPETVQRGYETNVCHYKTEQSILKCSRNEQLLVLKLLQRTETDCNPNGDGCCEYKRDDKLYDIGGCLLNQSDTGQKTVYQSALRDVLGECSQRRYCLLESRGTPLHSLTNTTLEGLRPSALLVNHECVKEEESVTLCRNQTRTGPHVYIGLEQTTMSPRETCSCTVRGSNRVQLLDVRLGTGRSRLTLTEKDHTVLALSGGDIQFMQTKEFLPSDWSLHLDVDRETRPHSIWIKAEGSDGLTVQVTCSETLAATSSSSSEAPTTTPSPPPCPVQSSPSTNCLDHYLPYVFLVLGLACGFLVGIVLVLYSKRFLTGSLFKKKPPSRPRVPPSRVPPARSPEEPVYSLPYNHQGKLIVVRSMKKPPGFGFHGNTQLKHSYSSNPTIDKEFVYSKGEASASSI